MIFIHITKLTLHDEGTELMWLRTQIRCDIVNILISLPKNGVFWDVTPCGYCKNLRFGGT
jgi:hypothetical protein